MEIWTSSLLRRNTKRNGKIMVGLVGVEWVVSRFEISFSCSEAVGPIGLLDKPSSPLWYYFYPASSGSTAVSIRSK